MPETEPILDPTYWKRRLDLAQRSHHLHHAIFRCPTLQWRTIEEKHKEILSSLIQPSDKILDCGCGWGRLLELLPPTWKGYYLGIDLCTEFIQMAREKYEKTGCYFLLGSLFDLPKLLPTSSPIFDWAILISIRPMIKRNLGEEAWQQMEGEIRKLASKLLFLEYDESDKGSVE